jgi:hypothetical protein
VARIDGQPASAARWAATIVDRVPRVGEATRAGAGRGGGHLPAHGPRRPERQHQAVSAGTRFAIAIIICWIAGSMLTGVIDRYARESRRNQALKMLAASRRSMTGSDVNGPPSGSAE